jgi:hypothetical protein
MSFVLSDYYAVAVHSQDNPHSVNKPPKTELGRIN